MKDIIKRLLFASAFVAAALTTMATDYSYPYCDGWWTSDSGQNPTYCPNSRTVGPNTRTGDCAYEVFSPARCECQPGSGEFTDIADCWGITVNGTDTFWSCKDTDCAGTYPTWTCSCASPYTYGPQPTTIDTVGFTLCGGG